MDIYLNVHFFMFTKHKLLSLSLIILKLIKLEEAREQFMQVTFKSKKNEFATQNKK